MSQSGASWREQSLWCNGFFLHESSHECKARIMRPARLIAGLKTIGVATEKKQVRIQDFLFHSSSNDNKNSSLTRLNIYDYL